MRHQYNVTHELLQAYIHIHIAYAIVTVQVPSQPAAAASPVVLSTASAEESVKNETHATRLLLTCAKKTRYRGDEASQKCLYYITPPRWAKRRGTTYACIALPGQPSDARLPPSHAHPSFRRRSDTFPACLYL